mgnify:CR=1|jgi:hypothetical protein
MIILTPSERVSIQCAYRVLNAIHVYGPYRPELVVGISQTFPALVWARVKPNQWWNLN